MGVNTSCLPGPWQAQCVAPGAVETRDLLMPLPTPATPCTPPSLPPAMFYFYSNHLHFSPEFLGWVALAGSCAGLAGVLLYNACLKNVPLKRMVLCCVVLVSGLWPGQDPAILLARESAPCKGILCPQAEISLSATCPCRPAPNLSIQPCHWEAAIWLQVCSC